jgi:hypothetical protein
MCGPTLYYNRNGEIGKKGIQVAKKTGVGISLGLISMLNTDSKSVNENNLELTEAITEATIFTAGAGTGLYSYGIYCEKNRQKSDKSYDLKIKSALDEMCKRENCKIHTSRERHWWGSESYEDYKVTFSDGVEISFTHDPSVIEVKSSPVTARKLEQHAELLQRAIWDTLKEVGLTTPMFDGPWNGGHIHIGVNESFETVNQLRNFLVDLVNHPELAEGILGADAHEAESLRYTDQGKRLLEIIASIDEDIEASKPNKPELQNIKHFLFKLRKDGYPIVYNSKYQTIELRFLRSQKDAKTLSLITSMFQARLDYLKNLNEPLKLNENFPSMAVDVKILNFKNYLRESGLKFEDYEDLLPSKLKLAVTNNYYSCQAMITNFLKKKK